MLSETVVSSMLTVSVAGAGFAVVSLALITPIFNRVVQHRLGLLKKENENFNRQRDKLRPASDEDIKTLRKINTRISELKTFPPWLGWGVIGDFMVFFLSMLTCGAWLLSEKNRTPETELFLTILIPIGFTLFLLVGMFIIGEVLRLMRRDWIQLNEDRKEAERTTGERLGELEKEAEIQRRLVQSHSEDLERKVD